LKLCSEFYIGNSSENVSRDNTSTNRHQAAVIQQPIALHPIARQQQPQSAIFMTSSTFPTQLTFPAAVATTSVPRPVIGPSTTGLLDVHQSDCFSRNRSAEQQWLEG